MSFPGNHLLHLGSDVAAAFNEADVVLVIDSDVPWLPAITKFPKDSRLFYLDIDPVKDTIPLWNYPAEMFIRADSLTALRQLNVALDGVTLDENAIAERRVRLEKKHVAIKEYWKNTAASGEKITPQYLVATLAEVFDEDTIFLNETITNTAVVENLLPRSRPGTRHHSLGSSLGWFGGAAIGMKLARPDREIVALTGDGTYIFSCPSAVYWVARKYNTPFMTIVFNNGGWTAPKFAVAKAHPDGYATRTQTFWTDFDPSPAYDKIAEAAGGAFAGTVSDPAVLKAVIEEGRAAVKAGRCAVINVILTDIR
jgi:acetolactate synthase-1/2/3 large subunit